MTLTDYLWCIAIIGAILLIPDWIFRGVLTLVTLMAVLLLIGVL